MTEEASEIRNLFVYGTLKSSEEVWNQTGKTFRKTKAMLRGYVKVQACGYDAVRRDPHESVDGWVLENVDQESLKQLDEYEGGLYRRVVVNVDLESGESVKTLAYVLPEPRWSKALRLVGWELTIPSMQDEDRVDSWRNKCRASTTPVSIFFAANSALLVFLGGRLVTQRPPCLQQWTVGVVMYVIVLALSLFTGGFGNLQNWRRKLALAAGAVLLAIVAYLSSYVLMMSHDFLSILGLLLLITSELFLVSSLEFYDSALNPDTHVVDVMNLEYGGSRFYFVALWLTVLSALVLFSPTHPVAVVMAPILWSAAIAFVNDFEDTYHVKQ